MERPPLGYMSGSHAIIFPPYKITLLERENHRQYKKIYREELNSAHILNSSLSMVACISLRKIQLLTLYSS